jgi:hypothetical protein
MAGLMAELRADVSASLPGPVVEATNFKRGEQRNVVHLALTGPKAFEAFGALIEDDAVARQMVLSGRRPVEDGPPPGPKLNEKLFGERAAVQAVATDLKRQFDYDAEVAAARKAYPAMLEKLRLAAVVAPPAEEGQGLTSLKVAGLRVVWLEGPDQGARPFQQPPSYSLSLIGEFAGPVFEVSEGRLNKVVTDRGKSLLPEREWNRKIHFPRLGENKKTVVFDIELKLPTVWDKKIKELAGTLTYTTVTGSRMVDLGLTELKAGAEGARLGASIESIKPSRPGRGQELTLKLTEAPRSHGRVRFTDEDGGTLEVRPTFSSSGPQEATFIFRREEGFPERGRIEIEVFEGLKNHVAPFRLKDVPLLGRSPVGGA